MNRSQSLGKENELITTLEHFFRKCYSYPQQARAISLRQYFYLNRTYAILIVARSVDEDDQKTPTVSWKPKLTVYATKERRA